MKQEKYNGYTNFETWKLCLNIDNEEFLYKELRNFKGSADDLRVHLEERFEFEDVGYKIVDFWSYNEWKEINWEEVIETRKEED